MQAIELEVNITDTHEIHLKLPDEVMATKARVIVMYEDKVVPKDVYKRVFGQYRDKITISESFDDELPAEFWVGKMLRTGDNKIAKNPVATVALS